MAPMPARTIASAPAPRSRRILSCAGIVVVGMLATSTADAFTLWGKQSIAVPGSQNSFCGSAHSDASVDISGHGNTVSGPFEYVTSFNANPANTVSPVKTSAAPMPAPPHDVAYYRALAQSQGTYFSGNVSLDATGNPWAGVIFAEQDIHVGGDVKGTVTLVAAHGEIHFDGSNSALSPAVDGLAAYAAESDGAISGSDNVLSGSFFVPANTFSCPGSGNTIAGEVVAQAIAWPGSSNQVGGECCSQDADCNDGKACTSDSCHAGACEHTAQSGCIPCTTAADCNDGNPCTTDACGTDGRCAFTGIPGCQRCTTAADCNDGNSCTTDSCTGNVCAHTAVPGCGPEVCNDGIDNDGDGLVDCADPDCVNAPECQPKREVCGNCIDDDGNGLTDYEDPACCAAEMPLAVKRMLLKSIAAKLRGNRLRLKARYATGAQFDPTTQDTTIQIADAGGEVFCQTVAASHWKRSHKRVYSFKDKRGAFAGGLAGGRFKARRNGVVRFRTRGRKVVLRPIDGDRVLVTLRVGNQCARETMTLRTAKKGLDFP